ncbi:MAG TPA: c-type cytochrome [Burkholderiaceae bacterium]|jgi:cytochrome c5|nr:c-type cytochrome [Burkholderiaceae bacterium]
MSDMSDPHDDSEDHASGIKTPRQLITVIAASFLVPIVLIVMLVAFVTLGNKESPGTQAYAASAVEARIAPLGFVQVSDPTNFSAAKTGEQVFQAQCTTCHSVGALGSPKFGDADAWAPRIAKGYDALVTSALHGKGNMPAQGGGDFSDFEIGRAVAYMANKGGAHFADPTPPVAASAASGATAAGSAAAGAEVAATPASDPAAAARK